MLFYKIFFYLLILFNGFYYDTKSIDDILLSVGGDKLSQREWDYIKLLKPMKPDLQVVALGLLERRGDGNAIKRFNASETKI